jgi:DinB family protein
MTAPPLDSPLLELTDPSLARPLPVSLVHARDDVLAAAHDLLAIPEAALARPWAWIGGSEEEVRYGAYRATEALEQAEIEARTRVSPADAGERVAARIVAPSTAARWDLHGLLLPLPDVLLDADPGGGEWTIRLTVGHTITSQRAYGWGTAWWLANPHEAGDPKLPEGVPEEVWTALPDEATAADGPAPEVRARLDAILDLSAERLAGLPDDRLALAARWSGFAVTVGFRLGRWSSHLREHTLQVEKTMAMLGHAPSEPQRLTRILLAAYGRAEATVFGRASVEPVVSAAERIARGAAEARDAIHAARLAAG